MSMKSHPSATSQRRAFTTPENRSRRLRKVRSIVTVSGRGVRGYFPSNKALGRAQFESLVEEDALRVLEIAPTVLELRTQPEVLPLKVGEKLFTYTPDVWIRVGTTPHYIEVKPDQFARNPDTVKRLRLVRVGMQEAGFGWSILIERDIRANGLQDDLKSLLRLRPVPGKQRQDVNHSAWDPLSGTIPDAETAHRWEEAKAVCASLLERVMRRDPGELFPEVCA